MADNFLIAESASGKNFRTVEDSSSRHWVPGVVAFATSATAFTVPVSAQLADGMSRPTTLVHGAATLCYNGTTLDLVRGDTTYGLDVDVTRVSGTVAVSNAGTFAVQVDGAALTSLQLIDDAVNTDGSAVGTKGFMVGGTDGTNFQQISVTSGGLVNIADGGGSLTVDGTVAATQSGTWSVRAQDGSGNALTSATRGSEQALSVQLVDGSGNQVTSFGGGTQYSEDAAHSTGATGTLALVVRADTAASTAGTDGDYAALITDANGRLHVNVGNTVTVASHAVTNAGTFAVQVDGSALTALQLLDDAVNTDGSAVGTKGYAIGGTDGTNFQTISVTSAGLVNIADGSGSITVDNGGTFVVQIDGTALTRLTDIETNTDSGAVVGNGTAAAAQRVTIANDSTGILAGVTTVTTVTTCSTLTGSGVAHDAADSGNPHKIGAKAETSLSGITLVADGDRTDLYAGVDGVLITRPHCNLEDIVSGNASNTDGTSTSVISAAGSGVKMYLTSATITNTSATDTYCELKSGSTVRWTVSVPANGGVVISFPVPLPPNAANEAWNFDMGAAVTTAYCSLVGFKSKV